MIFLIVSIVSGIAFGTWYLPYRERQDYLKLEKANDELILNEIEKWLQEKQRQNI